MLGPGGISNPIEVMEQITYLLWAPRLIDLGLIKVLNEIVNDGDIAIRYDTGQTIAIGIEKWTQLSHDGGGFHRPRFQPSESNQVVSQILQTQLNFGISQSNRAQKLTAHAHNPGPKDMFDSGPNARFLPIGFNLRRG